ncbi:hypothetical protein K501DRAFT_335706 [Backusella circina FSU 941]|nr:hypothetical protein K501DRAFT_335706 [Backusella circina FSU 941]
MAQGLIIPILFDTATERMHIDMLEKLITKTFGPIERLYLLDCILAHHQEWNDYIIQVIGFVLDTEPFVALDGIRVRGVLSSVTQTIQTNPKDKGSVRLLITLSKKYQAILLGDHLIDSMEQVAKLSKHMMSKSLLSQLNQLKKQEKK